MFFTVKARLQTITVRTLALEPSKIILKRGNEQGKGYQQVLKKIVITPVGGTKPETDRTADAGLSGPPSK